MDAVDPGGMQKWIGKKIKDFYRTNNYTQESFAEKLGYSDTKTIRDACKGIISDRLAGCLGEVMGKPAEYFLLNRQCPQRDIEYLADHGGGKKQCEEAERMKQKMKLEKLQRMLLKMDVGVAEQFLSSMEIQAQLIVDAQRGTKQ